MLLLPGGEHNWTRLFSQQPHTWSVSLLPRLIERVQGTPSTAASASASASGAVGHAPSPNISGTIYFILSWFNHAFFSIFTAFTLS